MGYIGTLRVDIIVQILGGKRGQLGPKHCLVLQTPFETHNDDGAMTITIAPGLRKSFPIQYSEFSRGPFVINCSAFLVAVLRKKYSDVTGVPDGGARRVSSHSMPRLG